MSRRDDVSKLYRPSKKLEKARFSLFCADIVMSLVALVITSGSRYITAVLVVIAFLYMAFTILDDGVLWYTAENARRKNNIQEAFHITLSRFETDGYYNNSISEPNLVYAVNTFESCFFTKELSERMLWKAYVKILASIAVVFIACVVINDNDVLLIIAQAAFSAFVIEDAISLILFVQRIRKLYDLAYHEFITVGISKTEQKVWLRYFCVEYESIKAHYKIRLDENLFDKLNGTLSEEWNKIQEEIKISEEHT